MGLFLPRPQASDDPRINWRSVFANELFGCWPLRANGHEIVQAQSVGMDDRNIWTRPTVVSTVQGSAQYMAGAGIGTAFPRSRLYDAAGAVMLWFQQYSGATDTNLFKTRDHDNDMTGPPVYLYIDNGSGTFSPRAHLGHLNNTDLLQHYWGDWPMQASMLGFPIFACLTWNATTAWYFVQHRTVQITRTKTLAWALPDNTNYATTQVGCAGSGSGTNIAVWDCRMYRRTVSRAEFDELRLNPLARADLYAV